VIFLDNEKNYGRTGQAADDKVMWRMGFFMPRN
jgi:hypothetical protein